MYSHNPSNICEIMHLYMTSYLFAYTILLFCCLPYKPLATCREYRVPRVQIRFLKLDHHIFWILCVHATVSRSAVIVSCTYACEYVSILACLSISLYTQLRMCCVVCIHARRYSKYVCYVCNYVYVCMYTCMRIKLSTFLQKAAQNSVFLLGFQGIGTLFGSSLGG